MSQYRRTLRHAGLTIVTMFAAAATGCGGGPAEPSAIDVSGEWAGHVALMDSVVLNVVQDGDGVVRGSGTYWVVGIMPRPVLVRGATRANTVALTLLDGADTTGRYAVMAARSRTADRLDGTLRILQPYGLGAPLPLTAIRR